MTIKKDNFKRISENRSSKILTLISQLANLSNSSFYEYTDEEIYLLFEAIEQETSKVKATLIKANDKKNKQKKTII